MERTMNPFPALRGLWSPQRLRDRRGSAVVELALSLPLLLLLLVGVVEVGRGIHAYLTVVQATQQAAQLSVYKQYTDDEVLKRLHAWAAPLQLTSATVQRTADHTEVRADYAIPIAVPLLRSALGREVIPIAVRAVAPPPEQ